MGVGVLFGDQGLGFRVWGVGTWDLGVPGLGFEVYALECRV